MGQTIDRLVLMSLLAGALYVFFISAMGNIPLASASAFLAMALLRRLTRRFTDGRKLQRAHRRSASGKREYLAVCGEDEAHEIIHKVVDHAYPGQLDGVTIISILRHPSGGKLTFADVCAVWKNNRSSEKLLIVSLQKADETAFSAAESLRAPSVRLIDGTMLQNLLASYPESLPAPPPAPRLSRTASVVRAACRARAGKCALTGSFMVVIFFLTGSAPYLAGAMLLLFIAGVSIHQRTKPAQLFS